MDKYDQVSDGELLERRIALSDGIEELKEELGRVDMEIVHRIEADNAKVLVTDQHEASRANGTPTLDYGKLTPLKEGVMVEEDLLDCYIYEHKEMVVVPEKWSLAKLNEMARKYGDPVGNVLEEAKIPGRPGPMRVIPRK